MEVIPPIHGSQRRTTNHIKQQIIPQTETNHIKQQAIPQAETKSPKQNREEKYMPSRTAPTIPPSPKSIDNGQAGENRRPIQNRRTGDKAKKKIPPNQ
jgi:hypothetical protein